MTLRELLVPARWTAVVDVGANAVDGDPPYKAMLAAGPCLVVGFEPQTEASEELRRRQGPWAQYLPHALGDGQTHTLHMCRHSGMASLLAPDPERLALFPFLVPLGAVVRTEATATRRLDDLGEVGAIDLLRMDVQGSELAILAGARSKLQDSVAVELEVSFLPLYREQPTFGQVDVALRGLGFVPHCFTAIKRATIAPCVVNGDPRLALNQPRAADVVCVRDFTRAEGISSEQLEHLALLAHHCYRSWDLALRCIMFVGQRGAVAEGTQRRYIEVVGGARSA
jgi:FkbM family methyltransferase